MMAWAAYPVNNIRRFVAQIHFCLGAPLARLEGQIALRTLTQRFPKLHLESNELRYKEQITIHGLAELRVSW